MPLRDPFRPPLDDVHSWDELHGMWPAMMVRELVKVLPEPYFAAPGVHLGTLYEIDVGAYGDSESSPREHPVVAGGVAVAYAPPRPTLTLEPRLPHQDVYEVRIYESRRRRRLVAAIEIVSHSNKDRQETRGTFVAKVASWLKFGVCVSIVDVVTTNSFNLYRELLKFLESTDPALEPHPPAIYALTMRLRPEGARLLLDAWYHPLVISQPLPMLPVWFEATLSIPLDLETSYEETCRTLRIR
jgi:hypothetical protein